MFAAPENEIPKGAIRIGSKETQEEDKKHTDTYYILPAEGAATTTRKVEVKKAPVYKDIGPTDEQTGMPVGLRSVRVNFCRRCQDVRITGQCSGSVQCCVGVGVGGLGLL